MEGVFMQAAGDNEYWDRYVVRPAQTYTRTGDVCCRRKLLRFFILMVWMLKDAAPGEGMSRNAKRRRREK